MTFEDGYQFGLGVAAAKATTGLLWGACALAFASMYIGGYIIWKRITWRQGP